MKVIELLNKIANGEQPPKKIKYYDVIYEYKDCDYFDEDGEYLTNSVCLDDEDLNDEVEIIQYDEIKLKLKEHIDLYELKQNHWNGCQYDTMNFLLDKYSFQEYFIIHQKDIYAGYYKINGRNINEKCFEIV